MLLNECEYPKDREIVERNLGKGKEKNSSIVDVQASYLLLNFGAQRQVDALQGRDEIARLSLDGSRHHRLPTWNSPVVCGVIYLK